jgi:hypothetical protein
MFTVRPFVSFQIDLINDFLKQGVKHTLSDENLVLVKNISIKNMKSIIKIKNYFELNEIILEMVLIMYHLISKKNSTKFYKGLIYV